MSKKALLLVRVSTLSQDFAAQKKELIAYAKRLGFNEMHIVENKESAIKLKEEERQGIIEMKEYLTHNEECKDVLVWELSRLARNESVLHSVKEWLIERKINLHVLSENITLLNALGEETQNGALLFSLYGHLASQEMKIKQQRMNRGRIENAKKGMHATGNKLKFGFTTDKNNFVILDKEKSKVVKQIYEMYASGKYTIKELQKEINELGYKWSFDKVSKFLSDVSYIGKASKRNILFTNYPRLLDDELFNKVQQVKKSNMVEKSKESVNKRLALKILRCWKCGSAYGFVHNTKTNQEIYICNNRKYYKQRDVEKCDSVQINAEIVDKVLVYIAQNEQIEYLSNLNEYTKIEIEKEIEVLEVKINTCDNDVEEEKEERERVNKMYEKGRITEVQYDEKFEEIEAREKNILTTKEYYLEEKERKTKILDEINTNTLSTYIEKMNNIFSEVFVNSDEMYNIIRERIKSAYVDDVEVNGRKLKVLCVITMSKKLLTFIVDTYAHKEYNNLVEIKENGITDFSVNENAKDWSNFEEVKDTINYLPNSKWISEQITNNFAEVRKAILPFQNEIGKKIISIEEK